MHDPTTLNYHKTLFECEKLKRKSRRRPLSSYTCHSTVLSVQISGQKSEKNVSRRNKQRKKLIQTSCAPYTQFLLVYYTPFAVTILNPSVAVSFTLKAVARKSGDLYGKSGAADWRERKTCILRARENALQRYVRGSDSYKYISFILVVIGAPPWAIRVPR